MEQYIEQRVHIVKIYYGNSYSVKNAFRCKNAKFDFFGPYNRLTEKIIRSV